MIFIEKQTSSGQDVFIRGGVSPDKSIPITVNRSIDLSMRVIFHLDCPDWLTSGASTMTGRGGTTAWTGRGRRRVRASTMVSQPSELQQVGHYTGIIFKKSQDKILRIFDLDDLSIVSYK